MNSEQSESTEKVTDKRLLNLRPPWKPGESGNPEGRPKGTKTILNYV